MSNKATTIPVSIKASGASRYPIVIGANLAKKFSEIIKRLHPARAAVITDTIVTKQLKRELKGYLATLTIPAEVFTFPAGEKNKNQSTVTALQHQLLAKKYGRDTLIIAFGGGVVGDVAGYVAATFLRGVPYIQMPTTLLAMVDSSIGGKVGVDTPYGKNTIGAFYQPRAVLMDTALIAKLPERQFHNGLFEAIKTFFTSDKRGLAFCEKIIPGQPVLPSVLTEIIKRSVRVKTGVVARDEREQNERRVINFGHTIGHALEQLSDYTLLHGQAVGYGMLVEVKIAERMGILAARDANFIFEYLQKFGITTKVFKQFRVSDIIAVTYGDKKVQGGRPYYVLLRRVGAVYKKHGQYAHPVKDTVVKKALQALIHNS